MFRITNASRLTAARGIRTGKDGKVPQTVSSPILKNCGRSEWQERWAAPQHSTIGGGRLWADHVDPVTAFARGGERTFAATKKSIRPALARGIQWELVCSSLASL